MCPSHAPSELVGAAGYFRGLDQVLGSVTTTRLPDQELQVACPKCKAAPGEECRSIKHGGPLDCDPYRVHKKRRTALIMGALVLDAPWSIVPARSARLAGPQVGLVDSAARDLP